MRFQFRLIILIVLTGCSKPKTEENQFTTNNKVDSIEATVDNSEADLPTSNSLDTLSYIGYIQKFDDNNLFYTDLYFIENFNYDQYDEITKMGDQIIFSDEETKRTRIEIKKAGQYFNLNGLKVISIYSNNNLKLTSGRLKHIEYVEDMIESRFVAVFEVDNPSISGYAFCIGNPKSELETINFSSYEDKNLESELIEYLKLNAKNVWSVKHYKLDQLVYSTVSADTTALIIETKDKTHKTLYKSKYSEAIGGLTMISKKINGRQILLTDCDMPETDMTWTSVLIFNGTEYETSRDHRIKD